MSEKWLGAEAVPGLRLGVRGGLALSATTGGKLDGRTAERRQPVYNAVCLGVQNGNPGLDVVVLTSNAASRDSFKEFCLQKLVTLAWFTFLLTSLVSAAEDQTPSRLGPDTVIETTLQPGTSHQYELQLNRGESAEVVIRQQGVDVVVELTSPGGKLLDVIDSPTGRYGDEVVEVMAEESGTYGIRVRPFDQLEPVGKYRLAAC